MTNPNRGNISSVHGLTSNLVIFLNISQLKQKTFVIQNDLKLGGTKKASQKWKASI